MNIDINCEYVMNNATQGVANCNSDIALDLTPLWITLSLIILFIAYRGWEAYKAHFRELLFPQGDSDDS